MYWKVEERINERKEDMLICKGIAWSYIFFHTHTHTHTHRERERLV